MKTPSNQETADNYAGVLVELDDRWRVIVCKDAHQWILQRRKKGGAERPWRAVGYFREREALIPRCATSCSQIDPAAQAILDALPKTFGKAN